MIIRSLLLLLPLAIWVGLFAGRYVSSRELTAMLLGYLWVFYATLLISIPASSITGLSYMVSNSLFYGVPLEWVFSQAIVIGALIPLTRRLGWGIGLRLFLQAFMLLVIVGFGGIVVLRENSVWFMAVLFLCSSVPALLLSDWTAGDVCIRQRATLQALIWAVVLFWFLPSLMFHMGMGSWNTLMIRSAVVNILYLLPMLIPGGLIISALYQFAIEGDGTAFPYDPPKRLVTGGIYRYISNPMQLGICLAVGWWGVVLDSGWIVLSSIIAAVLFIVFKDVCNGSCAIGKGNLEWEAYQKAVPKWLPALKPRV